MPIPNGGWKLKSALQALTASRYSEIEKRDCILDLADWADGHLTVVRGEAQ